MIAALLQQAATNAQPDNAAGWVAVITALTAFVVTACSAIAGLVVTIRNGRKADAVKTQVDAVHDCLHRQAEDVKAVMAATSTTAPAEEPF